MKRGSGQNFKWVESGLDWSESLFGDSSFGSLELKKLETLILSGHPSLDTDSYTICDFFITNFSKWFYCK